MWPETATDQDVITFDGIAVFAFLNFAGQKSDFADEMLRARVMTAGKMDIHGRIERNAGLTPARDILSVTLGVGSREFASRVAGACNQSGPDSVGFDRET